MTYIKTTNTNEQEIIVDILTLYNNGTGVELDPCYSTGRFWEGILPPKLKFDILPQSDDVTQSSCTNLPIDSKSIQSIMFDPPFVIGVGDSQSGIMTNRFSGFHNLDELKSLYRDSLKEFSRILLPNGLLVFKCQDTVTSGKQFLTHCFIINEAEKLGFTCHDLFILVRERAIMDSKWNKQQHARKTHSYYLVFSYGTKNPAKP